MLSYVKGWRSRTCAVMSGPRVINPGYSTKSWPRIYGPPLVLDLKTAMKPSVKALKHHLCLNPLIDPADRLK